MLQQISILITANFVSPAALLQGIEYHRHASRNVFPRNVFGHPHEEAFAVAGLPVYLQRGLSDRVLGLNMEARREINPQALSRPRGPCLGHRDIAVRGRCERFHEIELAVSNHIQN